MSLKYFTLDNFNFENKVVLAIIDMDLPIIEEELIKTKQFSRSIKSIKELIKSGAKVILLGNQNHSNEDSSLKKHLEFLCEEIQTTILFQKKFKVDEIKSGLSKNKIVFLENIQNLDRKEEFLNKLEEISDFYLIENFSLVHSKEIFITKNFKIPIITGRSLERELSHVSKINQMKSPRVYLFGGNEVKKSLELIKFALENNEVDQILLSGCIGELALISRDYDLGIKTKKLEEMELIQYVKEIKKLIQKYSDKIYYPSDVAIFDEKKGERVEIEIRDLDLNKELINTYEISDIGMKTVNNYEEILNKANSIYFKGPAGKFEDQHFEKGSKELIRVVTASNAFTFMGGGNSTYAAKMFNMDKQFSYISNAGTSLNDYLQEKTLPGLQNLQKSFDKYNKGEDDFIVVGSNTMDIKTDIPEKISQMEMGSKIKLDEDLKFQTGGGGVNVSITMSKFESKIGYLGKISTENKKLLLKTLKKHNIDLIPSVETKSACAKSILLQTKDNDRVILTFRGHNNEFKVKDVKIKDLKSNNFYFTSLNDKAFEAQVELAKKIKEANSNAKICFNPSLHAIKSEKKIFDLIKLSEVLIFNFDEAKELTGQRTIDDCLLKVFELGPKVVVITDGVQGTYAYNGKKQYFQRAKEVEKVVDTTGAGDCFAATFFYFYAKGYGIRSSLLYAASNAANLITENGTENGLLTYNELIKKKIF